jgi:hypothetical protein
MPRNEQRGKEFVVLHVDLLFLAYVAANQFSSAILLNQVIPAERAHAFIPSSRDILSEHSTNQRPSRNRNDHRSHHMSECTLLRILAHLASHLPRKPMY